jgi:peptide/nickel transport system ATP-binding protein/nickel transport system ATP-binding protein
MQELNIDLRTFRYADQNSELFRELRGQFESGVNLLYGSSGIGKTSLLRILAGATRGGAKGTLTLTDRLTAHKSTQPISTGLRALGAFVYVQQAGGVPGWMTVRDSLSLPERLAAPGSILARSSKAHSEYQRVLEMLSLPTSVMNIPFADLSIGMQRRVTLGQALLLRPKFVLLDEVLTGLDAVTRDICWTSILELATDSSIWLLTTHDLELSERTPSTVMFLGRGGLCRLLSANHAEDIRARLTAELNS